ncbi:hypothetical protein DL96DRAFT_1717683 [Flagelloscypha sp. PMI_526]|nr:hypothetical protein DL96DRAFT_1717683 [Flagelloscypha sp. PMI_526]
MSSSRLPLGADRALPTSVHPTCPVMNTEPLLHSQKDISKESTEVDELSDRFTAMTIPPGVTPTSFPIVPPPDRRYVIARPSIFSKYPMLQGDSPNGRQLFPQVPPLAAPYLALFDSDYPQSYPPSQGSHSQSSLYSDGDYWQYSPPSHYDVNGPSLSSSPADYSTATFIASPYDTVSWPPGEVSLATRSVQEAARRRRKRPATFRCELCPTDFTAKHSFENHMNSHRNIRPHKCKLGCGKSFATAQVLRRHEPKCKGTSSL